LNAIGIGKGFLPSTLIGDLTVVVKFGLSILIVNSWASKKGFLNYIGSGLAPAILNGPLGWGGVDIPLSMHWYSPPSADYIVSYPYESPKLLGSNLKLNVTSFPSVLSAGFTYNEAYSTEKSIFETASFPAGLALGSTG